MWIFGSKPSTSTDNDKIQDLEKKIDCSDFKPLSKISFPIANEIIQTINQRTTNMNTILNQYIHKELVIIQENFQNLTNIEQTSVKLSPSIFPEFNFDSLSSETIEGFDNNFSILSNDTTFFVYHYDLMFNFIIEELKRKLGTQSTSFIKYGLGLNFKIPQKHVIKLWNNLLPFLENHGYSAVRSEERDFISTHINFKISVYPSPPIITEQGKFIYYPKGCFSKNIDKFYCFDGHKTQPILFSRVDPSAVKSGSHVVSQYYRSECEQSNVSGFYQGVVKGSTIIYSDGDIRPILPTFIIFEFCDQSQAINESGGFLFDKRMYYSYNEFN